MVPKGCSKDDADYVLAISTHRFPQRLRALAERSQIKLLGVLIGAPRRRIVESLWVLRE